MARSVSPERKREGASALKKVTAKTIKTPSMVTVGSRPSRSLNEDRVAGEGGAVAASEGMTNGPFSLALGRVGRGTDADENDDPGDKPERIRRHAKQGEAILEDCQQHDA